MRNNFLLVQFCCEFCSSHYVWNKATNFYNWSSKDSELLGLLFVITFIKNSTYMEFRQHALQLAIQYQWFSSILSISKEHSTQTFLNFQRQSLKACQSKIPFSAWQRSISYRTDSIWLKFNHWTVNNSDLFSSCLYDCTMQFFFSALDPWNICRDFPISIIRCHSPDSNIYIHSFIILLCQVLSLFTRTLSSAF